MEIDTRICLVIPCYNEEERLPTESILNSLEKDPDLELCFVNDGSIDGTVDVLKLLESKAKPQVTLLELEKNSGKAEAVRQGMLHMAARSNVAYIGYFDADLATPLEEARGMIQRLPENNDVVMLAGSRVKLLGSTRIKRLWYRHYFGRIFATVVSNMLDLPVYDTQCGAKIFRRTEIETLFEDRFVSPWLFDVELFYRCMIQYGRGEAQKRIMELNITRWIEMGGSKIGPGFVLKVPFELWKIRKAYSSKVR